MKFDPNKVITTAFQNSYTVKYIVYGEPKGFDNTRKYDELLKEVKAGKIKGFERSGSCFNGLKSTFTKLTNRVLFKVDFKQRADVTRHLTLVERKRWVNLCTYHGLMPRYVGRHFYHTGNYILKFDGLSLTKLYAALVAARIIQECPETARATIHFRSKGLDFFLALLAAGRCTWSASGHTIFDQIKAYGANNGPNEASVRPKDALALKNYLNYGSPDEESVSSMIENKRVRGAYFGLQSTIATEARKLDWEDGKKLIPIPKLFSKEIQDKLRHSRKHLTEIKNLYRSNKGRPR